jgi:ferredoxin
MIVGERKPFEEIRSLLGESARILLVGCGTCVKVCFTGGDKEVAVLASQLRLAAAKARRKRSIDELTVERQCEIEFVDEVARKLPGHEVIMSMACGAGVQMLASRFPEVPVLPAVNTTFLGVLERQGLFLENCQGCGACVLGAFGGICPVSRCAKSLFNGPCGGSQGGLCEIGDDVPCAWHQIIERLKKLGRLENLKAPVAPKDWRSARHGGPRKLAREVNVL